MLKTRGFGLFSLLIGLAIMAVLVYYSLNLYERPIRPPVGSEEERLLDGMSPIDAARNAKSQVESRY